MKDQYDISIIVPFYHGNQYIDHMISMIENNVKNTQLKVELVIVNDSPEISVKEVNSEYFDIKIVNNKQNGGIHFARVEGIKASSGTYIMMLDQDDIIYDDTLKTQYYQIKGFDMIISNGEDENPVSYGKIYHSKKHQDCCCIEKYYYYVGNMIVSPGQCLIKKESIPEMWMNHTIKHNGCDDFMLWIMMFKEGKRFTVNYKTLYRHTYNGQNVSADFDKMKLSSIEMMTYLRKHDIITKNKEKIYMKRLKMREMYEGKNKVNKIIAALSFPSIAYQLYKLKKM